MNREYDIAVVQLLATEQRSGLIVWDTTNEHKQAKVPEAVFGAMRRHFMKSVPDNMPSGTNIAVRKSLLPSGELQIALVLLMEEQPTEQVRLEVVEPYRDYVQATIREACAILEQVGAMSEGGTERIKVVAHGEDGATALKVSAAVADLTNALRQCPAARVGDGINLDLDVGATLHRLEYAEHPTKFTDATQINTDVVAVGAVNDRTQTVDVYLDQKRWSTMALDDGTREDLINVQKSRESATIHWIPTKRFRNGEPETVGGKILAVERPA